MKPYSDFRPTALDSAGLGLSERQDWLVCPVSQARDSGVTELSNFRVVLADIGGEGEDVEVHRFGHWGPGWYEIILVRPGSAAALACEEWERALSDYPLASAEDHSSLEYERATEYWSRCSIRERVQWCQRYRASVFCARRDEIPQDQTGELISALAE